MGYETEVLVSDASDWEMLECPETEGPNLLVLSIIHRTSCTVGYRVVVLLFGKAVPLNARCLAFVCGESLNMYKLTTRAFGLTVLRAAS